ncbi:MAG: response regulator transcription factor [Bacteroidales bacterium]|nr:response regulator transcription factor [Bacteroidales bacterium]
MKKIKILIADDHQLIIDGIKSLINNVPQFDLIAEANNGKEAVKIAKLINPDIVLMDIDMPIMNGIEATEKIKSFNPEIKIIILSMHNEKGLVKKLIRLGADGYLLKNSDQNELIEAISKVASGQQYFSPEVTMSLLNKETEIKSSFKANSIISDLTDREIEILKLIAQGYSNKEIGEKLFISHRTVDTHRTNLMKKINVSNIAGIIRFAIKNGFVS